MDLSLFPREGASLRRVRLHGGGDALRARQQVERMLNEVDWSPAGLGPRALLLVRRIAVDARRGFAPRAEGGVFARQVSGALRERAAAARRPWLQRDAASAEAVCFADEAELLACLWRDWVGGDLPSHWWWGTVLRHRPPVQWLREQLFARGDRLVPVMALLATRGELLACVQRLATADAAVALRAVQLSHALPALDGVASAPASKGQEAAKPLPLRMQPTAAHDRPGRSLKSLMLSQLVEVVPELRCSFAATPPARRLLAVALALQRLPRWARSQALVQALAELDAFPVAELDAAGMDRPRADEAIEPRGEAVRPPSAPQGRLSLRPAAAAAWSPAAPALPQRSASSLSPAAVPEAVRESASRIEAMSPDADALAVAPVPQLGRPEARAMAPVPARPPVSASRAEAGAAARLHTGYGGLFYLLNIALAWRIYGDFTMPRTPGISLPPWDLLAWTGQAWFGQGFEQDPLWPLLAELSGREPPAQPGDDFDDAPEWAPRDDAPVACAEALAETHPGRRWLQHWRMAVEARLRSALGRDDAIETLCRHRAGVAVSEAAVDVTLSLAELPLALRFAGLDRDPGWIPVAGRSLAFHFE
ncbi:hypothetical protein [Roseateles sp. P5_D6]